LPDRGHVDRLLYTISLNRKEEHDTCHFDIGSIELEGRRRIRNGGKEWRRWGKGSGGGGEEGIIEFMERGGGLKKKDEGN
jgi:hypothetical protein